MLQYKSPGWKSGQLPDFSPHSLSIYLDPTSLKRTLTFSPSFNPKKKRTLRGFATMGLSKASLILVLVAVCALMGSAVAAEAPAPSPTSGTGSISPSFVSVFFAAVTALLFGSTLRI
ncbi:hypothetical protein Golax_007131 [Gossypium laxum]|uniref:Uncharacterized protein n=1 Tax=Gossypium laxum TaxID=34288 RepID=A0A7J9A5Y8_9ROSI|nr:hypothetical protein [Gossypium laxum]